MEKKGSENMEKLYTTEEVAVILRCSPYTVTHRHIKQGLDYIKDTTKKYLYPETSIINYQRLLQKRR